MSVHVVDKRGQRKSAAPKLDGKTPPPWWPVFILFEQERFHQLELWGDQRGHREDGTGSVFFRRWAEEYQRQNDEREEAGKPGIWAKVLLEEVFEALSETDIERLEHELVQAGAVITAWIEDLEYRKTTGPSGAKAA